MLFRSLNLGIFNLLPIPVLDGGMILMLLIEGTVRRDLSLKLKERIMQAGFALILLLAAFTVAASTMFRTLRDHDGDNVSRPGQADAEEASASFRPS